MEHCLPLDRLSRHDVGVAGGKGADLGELLRSGYAVPPRFVATTGAYRAAADALDDADQCGAPFMEPFLLGYRDDGPERTDQIRPHPMKEPFL